MALDLKIEIFAFALFEKVWYHSGQVKSKAGILHKIKRIYGEECCKVENLEETCNDFFLIAVNCRRKLFRPIYEANFIDEKIKKLKSFSDCYDYALSLCNRGEFFDHLTVFERMFATCGIVIELCTLIKKYNLVNVIKYGHTFWSMYFDGFTKQFYDEGGWEELKLVSQPYYHLYFFIEFFNVGEYNKLHELHEDYNDFLDMRDESRVDISKQWIEFRYEHLLSCVRNSVNYDMYTDALEVEHLLNNLKQTIANIFGDNTDTLDYDEYLDSLSLTNLSSKGENSDIHEVISTNQLQTDEFSGHRNSPDSVPDTMNLCEEKGIKYNFKEMSIEKTFEENCSLNSSDNKKDTTMTKEIATASRMAELELDRNSFPHIPKQVTDNLCTAEVGVQSKTPVTTVKICTNQIDRSLDHRESNSQIVSDATIFAEIKNAKEKIYKDRAEIKSIQNLQKYSLYVHTQQYTGDSLSDNTKRKQTTHINRALPEDEMDLSLSYRKPPPHIVTDTTFLNLKENVKSNSDEMRTEKTLEMTCSIKNDDDSTNIATTDELISASNMVESGLGGSSSLCDPSQQYVNNSYSGNSENHSETSYTSEALSKTLRDMSCFSRSHSLTVPDTANLPSGNDVNGSTEDLRTEKAMEETYILKTDGDTKKNVAITKPSQAAETEFNGLSLSTFLPNGQFMDTSINTSDNTKRDSKISNELDTLSKNQMGRILSYRKPPPCNVLDTFLSSENDENGSSEKICSIKALKVTSSPKSCEDENRISKRIEVIQTVEAEFNEKNFSRNLPETDLLDIGIDSLCISDTERDCKTPTETSSTNQMNAFLCYRKSPPYSFRDAEKGGNDNDEVRTDKTFEMKYNSKNRKDKVENSSKKDTISKNPKAIYKSELNRKNNPDIFESQDVLNFKKENPDGEKQKNEKAREDLRNEQNDRDMKIFLRMLLVLDDRCGTKSVLQALQSNEDGPTKTQVTKKKRKKKNKSKKKESND